MITPWTSVIGALLLASALAAVLTAHRPSKCDSGYDEMDWPSGAVTCRAKP